jgi:hypothetical protein
MLIKHYLSISFLSALIATAIFTGCKKDAPTRPADTTAAQDDASIAFIAQDARFIADGAMQGHAVDRRSSPCSVVSRRDTNDEADSLLEVNFGTTDCTSPTDGRVRRGSVFVMYPPNGYYTPGSAVMVCFQNYFVDDVAVVGTVIISKIGKDSAGFQNCVYTDSLTLTYPSGQKTTCTSQDTCTYATIGGITYYDIMGTTKGTSKSGATFTARITEPRRMTYQPYPTGCQYFEEGKVTINASSVSSPIYETLGASLGSCSNTAIASVDAYVYTFNQL